MELAAECSLSSSSKNMGPVDKSSQMSCSSCWNMGWAVPRTAMGTTVGRSHTGMGCLEVVLVVVALGTKMDNMGSPRKRIDRYSMESQESVPGQYGLGRHHHLLCKKVARLVDRHEQRKTVARSMDH